MEGAWNGFVEWAKGLFGDGGIKEFFTGLSMVKVYIACAVAGGTVVLGQTGLNLFGIGGADADASDADVDVEELEGSEGSLSLISIRTLSGFFTFFGLVGWTGTEAGWHPVAAAGGAFASGIAVMFAVAWIMRFFGRMQSSGNIEPQAAVGRTAQVYLRIPGGKAGKGKITVSLQGRSCEFSAVSAGEALPSGSDCRIVRMLTADTFEVAPLLDPQDAPSGAERAGRTEPSRGAEDD